MIVLKLNKDNRRRFTVKSIVTAGIVIAVVVISAFSISNSDKLLFLENNPVAEVFLDLGRYTNDAVDGVGEFVGDIMHFRRNANKVRELTKENEKLKQEITDMKSDESKVESFKKLEKALNYVHGDDRMRQVSASIVGKNDGDWYQSFVIDAGADSGIKKDSIVINGNGVVGIVYSVSNRYSKAISLVDSRASVSFKIQGKEDDKGVITTSSTVGKSDLTDVNKLLQGYLFDSNSKVKKGDKIVTSGLGLYPENLPIGKVTKVINDKSKSMKLIKVRPFVDFKKLNDVMVIPPRKIE